MIKVGDKIEMVNMPNDPCPIPAGTNGIVTNVTPVNMGRDSFTQYGVKWDNGRTLRVVVPPDSIRVVS